MTIERHLVLVHQKLAQDIADFMRIAEAVRTLAPDIDVFIAENDQPSSLVRKKAATRPSLVFSPGPLGLFRPSRGRIYQGRVMSKLDELRALVAGGARIPVFEELTPGTRLDPAVYGEHVVLKPADALAGSFARGIEVRRREDVVFMPPEAYPEGHPGRHGPMIVQRLVDTGPKRTFFRVLTLFGAVLSAHREDSTVPLPPIEACDPRDYRIKPDYTLGGALSYTHDPEVLDFASSVYRAFPEIPLQGTDVVRCHRTGMLYALEVNPGGNTWMFSRPQAPNTRRLLGVSDLSAEFDAFTTAARVLIEETRREAE
jgi:hypothetical protein